MISLPENFLIPDNDLNETITNKIGHLKLVL